MNEAREESDRTDELMMIRNDNVGIGSGNPSFQLYNAGSDGSLLLFDTSSNPYQLYFNDNLTTTTNDINFYGTITGQSFRFQDRVDSTSALSECPIHGPVSAHLNFNFPEHGVNNETYCLLCLRDMLSKVLDPLEKGGNVKEPPPKKPGVTLTRYDIAKQSEGEKMHRYRYLWQYAQLAYDRPLGNETLFEGKLSYVPMERGLDFGFIVEFPEEVIIAFRGTGTRTSDGVKCIKSWLSDFDIYPLRGESRLIRRGRDRHDVLTNAGILSNGSWGKGMIHNGFYTTWKKFKDEVSVNIEKLRGKPITCIGHSRGGALAELCARHIAKNKKKPCTLVEYGTPCVGTDDYVKQYQSLQVDATAIVNGYDLVANLPPAVLGLDHAPACQIWLKQPWWHKLFQKIKDHYQERYTAALEKYYP